MQPQIPKQIRWILIIGAIVTLAMLGSCSSESDADEIARVLADRLTDNLRFENGEQVAGGPPAFHEGEDWPQVEFVNPPNLTVTLGDSFFVDVKAAYDFPEEIDGAMVWVQGATSHIDIRDSVDDESLIMRLQAELLLDKELSGQTFDLYVSLYKGQETGLHETWRITIPDE